MGESLKLVGFGEHEGDTFGTKRVGSTPPVDEVSSEVFRWTQTNLTQNDSDAGDSGSPLFSNVNGTDLIIGIVMGGASNIAGVGSVATNTRIDGYLAWIQSIVPSVVVADVNDPPSLLLEDLTLYLDENSGLHLVGFEVSASDAVTFDVTTTNSAMFRNLGVDYEGSGLGDIVFETATNARGTATIIVTAYAGSLTTSQTITVTVEERNDPPTINATDTQVIDVNSGPHSLLLSGITAGIGENGPVKVSIVGTTPNNFFSSIAIGSAPAGSDPTDRLLSFTPAAGVAGGGSVTLELRDAGPDTCLHGR